MALEVPFIAEQVKQKSFIAHVVNGEESCSEVAPLFGQETAVP